MTRRTRRTRSSQSDSRQRPSVGYYTRANVAAGRSSAHSAPNRKPTTNIKNTTGGYRKKRIDTRKTADQGQPQRNLTRGIGPSTQGRTRFVPTETTLRLIRDVVHDPEGNSLKTRAERCAENQPDPKEARRGDGSGREFVPWCQKGRKR